MSWNSQLPAAAGHEWPELMPGWVWLAGAGPGDPGLVTLHTWSALQQADVIVHDALVDTRILQWARGDASIEFVGKRAGQPSPTQATVSQLLVRLARENRRVLRLKGGDPFVFGRGGEEAQDLLRAGVPFRVLPGVTAGIAGLAYAGIAVTHRDTNHAVTFLTGHDRSGDVPTGIDWPAVARSSPVIVLYMALRHLREIRQHLIAAGRPSDEPVSIICRATLADQRIIETTLGSMGDASIHDATMAPAVVCVGEVVRLPSMPEWTPVS
ncbi:uroporphyrinogen-III C-methyltransferase [Reyranella sp. CPCC 100927]|uniref:uroporphyrinogen-III C-methyltransferase n=1 Tax=Reyranella sp. CPCC 100927 TaxID=2599616 RepID=UPI0011B7E38C|nr:uroporphyrinogen-III C-methyltransferase [Reyranella sp. CPCC 100927]TWT10910.1 uroporphyrinogen-III C-methyltransferase [Reyranella sp. CPCC 100927]